MNINSNSNSNSNAASHITRSENPPTKQNQEQDKGIEQQQGFDVKPEPTQSSPIIMLSSHHQPSDQVSESDPAPTTDEELSTQSPSNASQPDSSEDEHRENQFHDVPLEDHSQDRLEPVHHPSHPITQLPPTPVSPDPYQERVESVSPSLTVQSSRPTPTRNSSVQETPATASPSTTQVGSNTQSSASPVLVISSLESISNSKEAKKSKDLIAATGVALALLKGQERPKDLGIPPGPNQEAQIILKPLKLACQTGSSVLMVTALDCIGKLVSYGFFKITTTPHQSESNNPSPTYQALADVEMGDEVTAIICDCFADAACPDAVQLQIIKALLALVLAPSQPGMRRLQVHQSSLLRAVRTVYNIFLLSKSPTNQAVAQGALTQIVSQVFGRVEKGEESLNGRPYRRNEFRTASKQLFDRRISKDLSSTPNPSATPKASAEPNPAVSPSNVSPNDDTPAQLNQDENPSLTDKSSHNPATTAHSGADDNQVTLESFEKQNSFDGVSDRDAVGNPGIMNMQDYHVKDAFLVFRALCKLSMKPLGTESERDLKSHAMRSKLLSLHLILSILNTNLAVFTDPTVIIYSSTTSEQTPFIQAIKQYICLSLSRNAISSVLSVFELSCEIFWKVVSGMRTKLKKEIEVLLNEIFLPILEMRNSTVKQKSILLAALGRLFHDPQALVEVYLNYDCDRSSLGNIYERFMNIVSKLATTQYTTSTTTSQSVELVGSPNAPGGGASSNGVPLGIGSIGSSTPSIPPSLSTTSMSQGMSESTLYSHQSVEAQLKRQSLECLVAGLQSLVAWAGKGTIPSTSVSGTNFGPSSGGGAQSSYPSQKQASDSSPPLSETVDEQTQEASSMAATTAVEFQNNSSHLSSYTPSGGGDSIMDDPDRFQTAKNQKTTLIEGIRQFNFKPHRGVKFLINHGFIRSSKPKDVARFLLTADGLSKSMIGEYLGEGDQENVDTMHAFIDLMDFSNMKFTEAMRTFLQAFRLPGEAQKIDRFMLKFAERYYQGNPGTLANAETAYVLAFSIILLNTDAHSPQVKNRMTKKEFIRNNRGINQGADLPEEYLSSLYDEILANEIRMKDEVDANVGVQHVPTGLAGSIATVGRDLQKEAYVLQSAGMANKTEILFRTLLRGQRHRNSSFSDQFYEASHFEHVKPMFQIVWMPLLAGLSEPLQNTQAEIEVIKLSLKGFKQAIKIICLFDLELERNAFLTTLSKFTFLNNLSEMKSKNIETIKTLLDIALVDGNYLKSSWNLILNCVSQLERFQLISQGVDLDLSNNSDLTLGQRSSVQKTSKSKQMKPSEEVTGAAGASHITYAADMVFSSSRSLSGTAIVDFVQALSSVSWAEIQASGLSGNPRTFCLQKLVEISYYNMTRIRLEWFQIWSILGEHFNQVCCHPNANVSFFALDSLRQLAMRFLEKEELANFKFQKDFLKPFEHTMIHSSNVDSKDMVLQCLNQMISIRVENLRSGWRTMFGVFSAASRAKTERVVTQAFELAQRINSQHFSQVVVYGSFADLTVCITDFCKISQFQKVSLHAIEMLKSLIPAMLSCPECPLSQQQQDDQSAVVDFHTPPEDTMLKFWFPILFAFYDVTMNGEDLEVRKRALDYLFETLKNYGSSFSAEFWDSVCKEVLFPIFAVLRSRSDVSRFSTQEDMSVWLSTTMIQALRNLVDLYTFYFDTLGRLLDRLLDLLCECICQENDTLARIGTSCLQQLLENNVTKLDDERWDRVVTTFVNLFRTTAAHQLFDPNLRHPALESGEGGDPTPSPMTDNKRFIVPTPLPLISESEDRSSPTMVTPTQEVPMTSAERKKIFRQIIVKCVLQLLLVETANELLGNVQVYQRIPPAALLRLLAEVDSSYRFAKKFNADKELRMGLWKVGFMKQLPNLLKQESSSAITLMRVLLKLYNDQRPDHQAKRQETIKALVPLALEIMAGYVELDPETQGRNIAAWTPVMIEVLHCFYSLDKETFLEFLPCLYPLLIECLGGELIPDLRIYVQLCLRKVGEYGLGLKEVVLSNHSPQPLPVPDSNSS